MPLVVQRIGHFSVKVSAAHVFAHAQRRKALPKTVHSQVLQNIVDRLDKSFLAFFRRCKAGEKPGFPRFRGMHRYDSFCYPQTGFALFGKKIALSKIGNIRIKMHRSIVGEIKTCTIKKTAQNILALGLDGLGVIPRSLRL